MIFTSAVDVVHPDRLRGGTGSEYDPWRALVGPRLGRCDT